MSAPAVAAPSPARQEHSLREPLAIRIFFFFWLAALVSNIGTWMQNVGAGWLMTSLSPSPLLVALIQSASSFPVFLLSLPSGALADIIDRRKLLILSQAWMLLAAGVLGVLTLAGIIGPWSLLGLTFLLGIGNALNGPAWQAAVHDFVSPELFPTAMVLMTININLSRAVGPAAAGLVVLWVGAGWTFVFNALSFMAVIVVLFGWRRMAKTGMLPAERVAGAIRTGLRYLRYSPPLQAVLTRGALFGVGGSAMWAMLPAIARHQMRSNAAGFGLLLSCFGVGAVSGGILYPRFARRLTRDRIMGLANLWYAAMLAGLALFTNLTFACVMMALGGMGWITAMTTLNVMTQLAVPQWVRGRAVSIYQMTLQGVMTASAALWGVLAVHYGLRTAMAVAALSMGTEWFAQTRFSLNAIDSLSFAPAKPPEPPAVADEPKPHSGPVMVTIEYEITPQEGGEFRKAMEPVRTIRLRNGAFFWGLFFDAAHPARFVEYFMVESWLDYLRQRERLTVADREFEARAWRFHIGGEPPSIGHQLDAGSVLADAAGPE